MSTYIILADLEGIFGVTDLFDSETNRSLLLAQIKRTIDCIKKTEDSIVKVCLIHDDGRMDIEKDVLDLGACYYGSGIKSLLSLESAADYAILIGFHSKAGGAGVFPHSFKLEIEKVSTDDKDVGEVYMFSKFFKLRGTKVIFVSGEGFFDDEMVFEGTITHYINNSVDYEDSLSTALEAPVESIKSFVTDDEVLLYLNNTDYYKLIDHSSYSTERKCFVFESIQ
ncbi:MAG: M55 family metallopeptidase, partial [Lachnospiraceae bacterium]|nr:M55 family metallopeptidase [Lachnospiraceae bacterium]